MKLKATSKQQKKRKKPKTKNSPASTLIETKPEKTKNKTLNFQINAILYNTIQNIISSLHTSQDFTYVSSTDFIRKALNAYKEGMELTELDEKGEKINTSIRVDQELKDFYSNLPDRMRSKLIERSIRTYIKNKQ
ncbi:MAG: hypothetical protein GY797_15220 [Deltaproteobacteria bacterium]|nr:hypothetical protein [Deltaproteobacteria bacterium]